MARSYLPESLKKRIPSIIAVVLTVAFFVLGFKNRDLVDPGLLTRLDFLVMDQKFKLRGFQPPGNDVVMVAFDDRTLDRYGTFRLGQCLGRSGRLFRKNLRALNLNYTNVDDHGLESLKPLAQLQELRLDGTGVTNADLKRCICVQPVA